MPNYIALYLYTNKQEQAYGRYKLGETIVRAGETPEQAVKSRVSDQKTASSERLTIIAHWPTTEVKRKYDKQIHSELYGRGYRRIQEGGGTEWIESLDTEQGSGADLLVAEINDILTGRKATHSYPLREEQSECVEQMQRWFSAHPGAVADKSRFLVDAKPRFGKTFTTLNAINALGLKNILLITYTPEALQEWVNQIRTHVNFADWESQLAINFSATNAIPIGSGKVNVLLASAQDMLDYENKTKWSNVRDYPWDAIIFDEFDFGGLTEKARGLLESINSTKLIALTGTAFQLYTRRYFQQEAIYTWTYEQEQAKRRDEIENHSTPPNRREVYRWLPQLNFAHPVLGDRAFDVSKYYDDEQLFSFRKFFATAKNNTFEHENDVQQWLRGVMGRFAPDMSPYRQFNLKHSLWLLPSVAACKAMLKLLRAMSKNNELLAKFEVIDISGDGEHAHRSYQHINNVVRNKEGNGSITLSVKKFTRGVTVPEWDSVFMLFHGESVSLYFQAGFRAQSPWREGDKQNCYIVDYDINRILRVAHHRAFVLNEFQRDKAKDAYKAFFDSAPIWSGVDNSWNTMPFDEIWERTKEATHFSKVFTSSYTYRMVNVVKINSDAAELFKELAAKIGKGFTDLAAVAPSKIVEFGENQSSLKNTQDTKRVDGGVDKSKQSKEEAQTLEELARIGQDIISDVIKFVFVFPEHDTGVESLYNTAKPELFETFTDVSVDQFRQLVELGVFDKESLNETILALHDEELEV